MKIFQILHGMCHWETPFKSLDETFGKFPTDCLFVEAPDYVTEQWGFDEMEVGDDRFIAPSIPEDLVLDDETGTFVEEEVLQQALVELKEEKTKESADKMAEFLAGHPLTYTNDKKYPVTAEALNDMRNAITAYNINKELGIEGTIPYAAVGEIAEEWTYEDFRLLYVACFNEYNKWQAVHQGYAAQIEACESAKEVRAIELLYETEEEKAEREAREAEEAALAEGEEEPASAE